MPDLLLQLLRPEYERGVSNGFPGIGIVESVFPALDIIRRAGPPGRLRDEIYKCVSNHLASKIWHIRDIAARTICTLLLHNDWLQPTLNLIETCGNLTNRHHGVLMSVKYLLERRFELKVVTKLGGFVLDNLCSDLVLTSMYADDLLVLSTKFCENYGHWQVCPVSEATYEEIVVTLLKFIYQFVHDTSMQSEPEMLKLKSMFLAEYAVEEARAVIQQDQPLYAGETVQIMGDSATSGCSALLRKALVFRAVYTVAIEGQISDLESLIETSAMLDIDTTRALLEHLPLVWNVHDEPAEVLLKISNLYVVAYTSTISSEIRSTALRSLSDILEQLLKIRGLGSTDKLQMLHSVIIGKGSPDLLCAEIQVTGSLMVFDTISARENDWAGTYTERIEDWGMMLLTIGKGGNVRILILATFILMLML